MFYCNERLVFEYKVSNILILKSKDHSPILTFGIELINYHLSFKQDRPLKKRHGRAMVKVKIIKIWRLTKVCQIKDRKEFILLANVRYFMPVFLSGINS